MKSGFKRVYAKNGRWWFVDTANKWLPLTRIEDGKAALARAVHALVPSKASASCLSGAIDDFKAKVSPTLAECTRKDYWLQLATVEAAFSQFPSPAEIEPVDVERFLDQWSGNPRSQQAYRNLVIRVFQRAVLRGDCKYNPAREIPAVTVPKRDRYVEDDEFIRMLDTAQQPDHRGLVHGDRHALIWQLAYLTGQRSTDIRLLRKSDVSATHLRFQPTKTRRTTKATIDVPITAAIRQVLDDAAALKLSPGVDSMYVIPQRSGQPFTASTLTGAWNRTRARAGLSGANIMARDLRAKAISDGEFKQGLDIKELQKAATHSSEKMTRHYARKQRTPESPLRLEMPRKKAGV